MEVAATFENVMIALSFFGGFAEFLVLVFLIFNCKNKQSIFSSSYFRLLSIGYFFELLCFLPFIFKTFFFYYESSITLNISQFCDSYMVLFIGPWNIALCLNRFTSVKFDKKHENLWKNKNLCLLSAIIIIYPLCLSGYIFFNPQCQNNVVVDKCNNFVQENNYILSISNGICAFLSLVIGISTYKILSQRNKNQSILIFKIIQTKIERNLLLQSFITSVFYLNFVLTMAAYPYFFSHRNKSPANFTYFIVLLFLQNIFYMLFHYSSFILLLIFSGTLRSDITKFYRFKKRINFTVHHITVN